MKILTPCREVVDSDLNRTARALLEAAIAAGWRVRATFASAESEPSDDDEAKRIDSVVIRMRRLPLAAVGAWHNGKFELAYVWSTVSAPRKVGARDLATFVKAAAA